MPTMCLCFGERFSASCSFLSYYERQSFTEATEKLLFGEKRPLNGKFSKFRHEKNSSAHDFTYSCQVWRKSVKRKRPNGCVVYSSRKNVGILPPFSAASGAILSKILQDHSFPIPHFTAMFCPNPSNFRGDISENVLQTHYNIGVKPVGFLPTIRKCARCTHYQLN